jgi:hypothetical protein
MLARVGGDVRRIAGAANLAESRFFDKIGLLAQRLAADRQKLNRVLGLAVEA